MPKSAEIPTLSLNPGDGMLPRPNGLFTKSIDIVDFDNVVAGTYAKGTQYNALAGNDTVYLASNEQQAREAGFRLGSDFRAGTGDDAVYGRALNDRIFGDAGNDTLGGGTGRDYLDGGTGNDTLLFSVDQFIPYTFGTIPANGGVNISLDTYIGGTGIDTLRATDGNDHILRSVTSNLGSGSITGVEIIHAGAGNDVIDFANHYTYGSSFDLNTAPNPDTPLVAAYGFSLTIYGGDGFDSIRAAEGDDVIFGEGGTDFIDGRGGNDYIDVGLDTDTTVNIADGGDGNDMLVGGLGMDYFSGGDGNDVLLGNTGDDILAGGNGVDWLFGGAGSDIFDISSNFTGPSFDRIGDMELGVDRINLYTGAYFNVRDFADVFRVVAGADGIASIQIDRDGLGTNNDWQNIAYLDNVLASAFSFQDTTLTFVGDTTITNYMGSSLNEIYYFTNLNGGGYTVDAAAGNDQVRISTWTDGGAYTVNTGAGFDQVSVYALGSATNISIDTGADLDSVYGYVNLGSTVNVDTGAGADNVWITAFGPDTINYNFDLADVGQADFISGFDSLTSSIVLHDLLDFAGDWSNFARFDNSFGGLLQVDWDGAGSTYTWQNVAQFFGPVANYSDLVAA